MADAPSRGLRGKGGSKLQPLTLPTGALVTGKRAHIEGWGSVCNHAVFLLSAERTRCG